MPVWIGTSGWQYRHWRATFYPEKVAQRSWLEHYATRFRVVELNNSFYRLPAPEVFDGWAKRTPADFIFAVKMSRYLSHLKRLREPSGPIDLFLDRARHLGDKLGPVLIQLPPDMTSAPQRLVETLDAFPSGVRIALEMRHESWFNDEIRSILTEHGAALCMADSPRRTTPEWKTAAWGYLRLHEGASTPHPCYGRRALAHWADRLAQTWEPADDLFVFFNNDGRGCAPRDAAVFAEEMERVGLQPTRVPSLREVHVRR